MGLISNIYGSKKALLKVGSRKNRTFDEIEAEEMKILKPKVVGFKKFSAKELAEWKKRKKTHAGKNKIKIKKPK